MVDKQRGGGTRRAISLAAYPLIREFLSELAGTFVLVVYKKLEHPLWATCSDSLIFFFYRYDLFVNVKLCIIGTKAQAVLTNGKLAEFLANRFGDGFGKRILLFFCLKTWLIRWLTVLQWNANTKKASWPVFGLPAVWQVRYWKEKKHSKFCKSFMFYISCQGGHLNPAMTFAFASTGKRKMDLCKHAISEYT